MRKNEKLWKTIWKHYKNWVRLYIETWFTCINIQHFIDEAVKLVCTFLWNSEILAEIVWNQKMLLVEMFAIWRKWAFVFIKFGCLSAHVLDQHNLHRTGLLHFKPFHLKNLFLRWLRILENKNYTGLSSESWAFRKLISEVSIFTPWVLFPIYIVGSKIQ